MADIDFDIADPTRVLGIDVSHWTGVVDWAKAKANGVKFAIIKAANGLNLNIPFFKENYKGAKDQGILVGAYQWLYPPSVASPGTQARKYLELLRDYPMDIPPGVDFEWTSPKNPDASDLYGWVIPYEDGAGQLAMIYSALGYWNQYGTPGNPFWALRWLWQAHYTPATFVVLRPWLRETILQFTEKGEGALYGVPASGEKAVDLNYFNGTLEALYAWAKHPVPPVVEPPITPPPTEPPVTPPPVTPPVTPPPMTDHVIETVRTRFYDLALHMGPGVTYKKVGKAVGGAQYNISQIQGRWGRIQNTRNWLHLDYVIKVSGGTTPTPVTQKYVTGYSNLRRRTGPGTGYSILGYMVPNQAYDIVAQQNGWGRISGTEDQWVSLAYCTRVV